MSSDPSSAPCHSKPVPLRWHHAAVIGMVLLIAFGCYGCRSAKRRHKPLILMTRGDIPTYVTEAVEHRDADMRRGAIRRLAASRYADDEAVLDAFAMAARQDVSEPVRCAAVDALVAHSGSRGAGVLLALLSPDPERAEIRLAGAELRWAAMRGLSDLAGKAETETDTHAAIHTTAIRSLLTDSSRDVRLLAARLLGRYATHDSLEALIKSLRQDDFGIVYESERSLERLTGKTFEHDPARWRRWLVSTEDPFADKGMAAVDANAPSRHASRWLPWNWFATE